MVEDFIQAQDTGTHHLFAKQNPIVNTNVHQEKPLVDLNDDAQIDQAQPLFEYSPSLHTSQELKIDIPENLTPDASLQVPSSSLQFPESPHLLTPTMQDPPFSLISKE